MKKRLLILLALLVLGIGTAFANGFRNTQEEYFYDRSYENIEYVDSIPGILATNYYFALSYDGGVTWKQKSEKARVSAINKYPRFTVDTTKLHTIIGIFTDPEGVWDTEPVAVYTTNFLYAECGTITTCPKIYSQGNDGDKADSKGTYKIVINYPNRNQLPANLKLEYSVDGDNWLYFAPIQSTTQEFTFTNPTERNILINKNIEFRVVYTNNEYALANSEMVPFEQRDTYFRCDGIVGGLKEINSAVLIGWSRTENFNNMKWKTTCDDIKIDEGTTNGEQVSINIAKFGNYRIVGWVKDANFSMERAFEFTVGDPCDIIRAENARLKKNDTLLHIRIAELENRKPDTVKIYCTPDGITEVCVTLVENMDRVLVSDNYLIIAATDVNISDIWLYDSLGKCLTFWKSTLPANLHMNTVLQQGQMYFVWIRNSSGQFNMYKVVTN